MKSLTEVFISQPTVGPEAGVIGEAVRISKTITITASPDHLYYAWRDFSKLAQFMDHLETVSIVDDKHSHWVAKGPVGFNIEWDAEITQDIPGRRISWKSLEGSDIRNEGSVTFNPIGQNSTIVHVELFYNPPAGMAGRLTAQLLGSNPEDYLQEDLKRFKALIEQGGPTPLNA